MSPEAVGVEFIAENGGGVLRSANSNPPERRPLDSCRAVKIPIRPMIVVGFVIGFVLVIWLGW
jgi:hypothetical protein